MKVFEVDDADNADDDAAVMEVGQLRQVPPPPISFKTCRVVWVDVKASCQQVGYSVAHDFIGRLLGYIATEGLATVTHGKAHGPDFYRAYHLPADARKIEAWLQKNGAERVAMVVEGIGKIEP